MLKDWLGGIDPLGVISFADLQFTSCHSASPSIVTIE
jgi:hypothetical protein